MSKKLGTFAWIVVIGLLMVGVTACDKSREPLTAKEKALIDKAVFDKKSLTQEEQKHLDQLRREKNEAETYMGQKEHEREMKNWDKKSTAKPPKDFP